MSEVAPLSFDFSVRPSEYWEPLLDKIWFACFSGNRLNAAGVADLTRRVLDSGPEIVLVTQGPRGASLATAAGDTVQSGAAASTPLDTLGAGDAVIGTVLAGLLRNDKLQTVMHSAMEAAAQVCRHYGAFGHGQAVTVRKEPQVLTE
jgi:fructoselysine 6-kinase